MRAKYFLLLLGLVFLLPAIGNAQTFSGARVYRTTNQSIANNTQTLVGFPTESSPNGYDWHLGGAGTYHDTVTNVGRLTVPAAGFYRFVANIYFASNAAGIRTIQIRRNGTTIIGYCSWEPEGASTIQIAQCVGEWEEQTPSAYYEVYVYQNSGTSLDVVADSSTGHATTWFSVQLMGD